MSYINWVLLLAAFYLISMALMMKTPNFASSFVFKIIPFFLGVACLLPFLDTIKAYVL